MAICNEPDEQQRANLIVLAGLLDQVADILGHGLTITSGFRCAQLNAAVGGVPDSQHIDGLAADFKCPQAGSAWRVARLIAESPVAFDQLILEYGKWVHISAAPAHCAPRRQVLTILSAQTGYTEGLPADEHETART